MGLGRRFRGGEGADGFERAFFEFEFVRAQGFGLLRKLTKAITHFDVNYISVWKSTETLRNPSKDINLV